MSGDPLDKRGSGYTPPPPLDSERDENGMTAAPVVQDDGSFKVMFGHFAIVQYSLGPGPRGAGRWEL